MHRMIVIRYLRIEIINIENYNYVSYFKWVCGLVSVLEGVTKCEGAQEKGRCFGVSENNKRVMGEMRCEELHKFSFPPNITRVIKSRIWARNVARIQKRRSAHVVLVGQPEGKKLGGRLRRIWDSNMECVLKWWFGRK